MISNERRHPPRKESPEKHHLLTHPMGKTRTTKSRNTAVSDGAGTPQPCTRESRQPKTQPDETSHIKSKRRKHGYRNALTIEVRRRKRTEKRKEQRQSHRIWAHWALEPDYVYDKLWQQNEEIQTKTPQSSTTTTVEKHRTYRTATINIRAVA